MNNQVYALAIVAHPDDESFLLAGTTLMLQEQSKSVAVICATRGEKGVDRLKRELSFLDMAKIRTNELLEACNILHCDCKKIMDHPDGKLDQVDFNKLVHELVEEINRYEPQVILTFGNEGISGHLDHITIGKAAVKAAKQSSHKSAEIWLASIPASQAENFHNHMEQRKVHHLHFLDAQLKGVPDEKLTRIDVRKYKELKLKALEAHQSQYVPHLTWSHFLEEECFEVIKLS